MFLQVCVILFTGGVCGCSWGGAWLLPGGGACMVALGGGMRGCSWGVCVAPGGHTWLLWGVCVVAPGGHAWLLP